MAGLAGTGSRAAGPAEAILPPATFAAQVARFNALDVERVTNVVADAEAFEWMASNIPRFACPDGEVEEIYYFRWWSFRKHLRRTPEGWVVTEFLPPARHAGAYNTISCAAGHHLAEGRWLHDPRPLDETTRFWLRGHGGKPQAHFHAYSGWFAAAVWDRFQVTGDRALVVDLLDDLVADYRAWERERALPDGLLWQYDVRDGMEESIGGS